MAPQQLGLDTAAPFVPDRPTLPKLRAAAAGCTACHLYKLGTQTVFGEGSADADVVFVGEQPGDPGGSRRAAVRGARRPGPG